MIKMRRFSLRHPLGMSPLLSALLLASFASAQEAPTALVDPVESANSEKAEAPRTKPKDEFAAMMNRPGGLTADQAARQAAEYSQDAIVAQEQYKSADAQVDKTIYNYAPRVTLSASYTRQSRVNSGTDFGAGNLVVTQEPVGELGTDPQLIAIDGQMLNFNALQNNYHLNARMTVPISDYLLNMSQALSGANAAKDTARYNEEAARLQAAAQARLAYYDWVATRLRLAEIRSAIKRAEAQLDNLKQLQSGGRVSRADVLRQDAFLANSEMDLRRVNTQEAIAREILHVAMTGGKGPTPNWSIGDDVFAEQKGDQTLEDISALHEEARRNRLEIRALESTAYALEQKATVQRTQGYPRIEGFGVLTYANPNPRFQPPEQVWRGSWDVGVQLSWTLNDLGASYSDAKSTDADVAQVRAQKKQLEDTLRTEVLTSRRALEEARLARESALRGVAASEAAYEDRVLLFENGRATSLDVLQSESSLVTARMNLVDAYVQLRIARVRLDHAVGRDIPPGLGAEKK